jgi:serine/threonine protein kinase
MSVLEPVSEPLRRRLLELNLCSAADLRASRRTVRRLTSDLPAFDSVWLDALVQRGKLTPHQAKVLESSAPEQIQIGPFVAVSRLAAGRWGETLLARLSEGGDPCVLKVLRSPETTTDETIERLQTLIRRGAEFDHPAIAAPSSVLRIDAGVVIVSRYIRGPRLDELLVRRGRFPAAVVLEIARQLCEGLAALWQRQLSHADIRAGNARLTQAGQVALVDAGVRAAIAPCVTIHSGLSPDKYDGIAPELIGASATATLQSDAYALGCLLWQLLAGRPPFPSGDSLIKLAAHQTRTIDDVRTWAPDAPAALAEGIARLTARNPAKRPASAAELVSLWGTGGGAGRRRLAAFRRRFDAPPRTIRPARPLAAPLRWLFFALTFLALTGVVVSLSDMGARNLILEWAWNVADSLAAEPSSAHESKVPTKTPNSRHPPSPALAVSRLHDLPAPDQHGVIHLDHAGPFRASEITVVGPLTIVGDEASSIIVADRPLKICAESVRVENVTIRAASGALAHPPRLNVLILVQAQELSIEHCVFDSGESGPTESVEPATRSSGPALVAWKLLDQADPRGGSAAIRNSSLFGDGPAIYLAHAVQQLDCDNVLKVGPGPLIQLAAVPRAQKNTVLHLVHTTCRRSGAVLRWIVPSGDSPHGRVLVEAGDCVFDLIAARTALFELAGSSPSDGWLASLRMLGEGSVTAPGLEIAGWISTVDGRVTPLDASSLELEGLLSVPFQFAGRATTIPADSQVREIEAPRRSGEAPGIRASGLPAARGQ